MPRYKNCRFVSKNLKGIGTNPTKTAVITVDELEAFRLYAIESMHQEQAASLMGVSRATYARILKNCQAKIAKAILQGDSIEVEEAYWVVHSNIRKGRENMKKIAVPVISNDEKQVVSDHFGKAPFFAVVELEGENIKKTEFIENKHEGGCANVVGILGQNGVNVLLVKGIGGRPKLACDSIGISVYRAERDTVSESVIEFIKGSMDINTCCGGHSHEHGDGCHDHKN